MENSEDLDILTSIIDLHECETKPTVPEPVVGKFKLDNGGKPIESSEVHAGDTDSSDDEDNRNYFEQKYNNLGKFAKAKLKETESKCSSSVYQKPTIWKKTEKGKQTISTSITEKKLKSENISVENYSDVYGIRIINPLISSQSLKEKMSGRQTVSMDKINYHIKNLDSNKDWVIAGVIVNKCTRTSQKGKQYCVWTLSDLRPGLKTVSLFLFGKAYAKLWKTSTSAVVAVLNPTVMESKCTGSDVGALSINDADQVMMWGTSKDLGVCKAIKKNGDPCSSFVNKRECDYCIYHVKQEYKKFTGRSELQSPSGGNLQNLRNKVLGKNEVFYGGKSYTADTVVAKRNVKEADKDKKCLLKLGGALTSVLPSTIVKPQGLRARSQQIKDAERLRKLTGSPVTISSTVKNSLLSCGISKNFKTDNRSSTNSSQKECNQKNTSQKENNHLRILSEHDQIILREKDSVNDRTGPVTLLKDSLSSSLDSEYINLDSKNIKGKTILGLGKVNKCKYKGNRNDKCTENKIASPLLNEIKQTNSQDVERKLKSSFHSISKNNLKTKIQPTKTRFENLTKEHSDIKEKCNSSNMTVEPIKLSSVNSSLIDLSSPVTKKQVAQAKMNAVRLVKKFGPIKKVDPNAIRNKSPKKGTKRKHKLINDDLKEEENINGQGGKCKLSARFLELMNATSQNEDLIEIEEQRKLEEYYSKMEKKEQLEEKMLTTFKIDCKAVKCIKCNYKWFSASELCKSERHPLKVITAIKRFFKCGNCSNRTVSLEIIPLHNCKQCASSRWERAPMLKERKSVNLEQLSIRGGEQTFMNSVVSNGNLNLIVPE